MTTFHEPADEKVLVSEVLECLGDGIGVIDRQWVVTFANQRMTTELGFSPDAFVGRKIWEAFSHLTGTEFERRLRLAMEEGQAQDFEMHGISTDRWRRFRVMPSRNGIVVSVTDITEKKATEQALEVSERRYRELLTYAPTAIYEVDFRTRRFTTVNEAMCQLSGYSRDELLAMDPLEIMDDAGKTAFQERMRRWLAGEAPETFAEYRVRAKDGRTIYAMLDITFTADEQGQPIGAIVVGHDVTARRQAEEREERLQALMNHNPSLIFMKDEAGRYVYLNKAYERNFALSKDWPGKTDFDFWPQESAELFRANDAEVLAAGQMQQFLEDSFDLEGKRHCWLCYKFPFTDASGHRYIGGIGIDAVERVRAEEALQESETRFHMLAGSTFEGIAVHQDGVLLDANEQFARMHGYTVEEVIGRPIADFILPEDVPRAREAAAQATDVSAEYRDVRKDGTIFPVEAQGRTTWLDGRRVRITAIRDITERKRAEQVLKESEVKYRELADSISDPFFTLDRELRVTYWNVASERNTGITSEAIIGKFVLDIFPEVKGTFVEQSYRAVLTTGMPQSLENRWDHPDGSVTYHDVSIYPASNGIAVFSKDITERRQVEEALRESEEKFRMLAEITQGGIAILQDGLVVYANPFLLQRGGYREDEVVGHSFLQLIHPDHREMLADYHQRRLRGEEAPTRYESAVVAKDGAHAGWFEFQLSEIEYRGRPAFMVNAHEITERKQMEEELREADRAKDEFLTVLSHELQTPLTSILGWSAEALREGLPEMMAHAMAVVHRNAMRQKRLVSELLDISRLIHRKIELNCELIDLSEQAQHAVESMQVLAGERKVQLTFAPCADPLPVHADAARLQQIIGNLLSNGLKFTPVGGTVTVRCRRDATQAILTVEDTGRGIPEEELATIFELFRQVDRDESAGGLGLGLAISRGIIELHGGYIFAESEGPERGSRFTVVLPVADVKG